MPTRRLLAAVIAAIVAVLALAVPAAAHTVNKSKPVLFVHGYNPTSNSTNCGSEFDGMIAQLRREGYTGPMVRVGFYSGDVNCDVNLRSYGSFGNSSSWKSIAKAFSSYVQREYTARGVAVDVVGYSMGGLIARGGVYGAQRRESGFAAPIDVEDGVTLGTPHRGAAFYSEACFFGQCASLKPSSADIAWLNQNGNPQGRNGSDWTNVGSYADIVVPVSSATSMTIPSAAKTVYGTVTHFGSNDYMSNSTSVTRSGVGLEQRLR